MLDMRLQYLRYPHQRSAELRAKIYGVIMGRQEVTAVASYRITCNTTSQLHFSS